ncbi:DNA-directed RNA polymerase subunit omega [Bacillus marinisedimentorum]|uniref:DNA-directed RNA polymerase subunit omega n=1 Tax=Bacillus marinisedimentorum TaxID=1821260 RepID=UPI0009F1BDC1|nr:DNA-directed RNA polymerase subunit omega [Bacillus marinisedimentorum]
MLYPSIDTLMEKIDSKYTLVTLAAKRARQIQEDRRTLIDSPSSNKYVGMALEEIQDGKLKVDVPE